MPPPVPAGTQRTKETSLARRVNQAQYIEERLRIGIPSVAVAAVAALLTQRETMQALPVMSLAIILILRICYLAWRVYGPHHGGSHTMLPHYRLVSG